METFAWVLGYAAFGLFFVAFLRNRWRKLRTQWRRTKSRYDANA